MNHVARLMVLGVVSLAAAPSLADTQLLDAPNACTVINCNATFVPGALVAFAQNVGEAAAQWTGSVFAGQDECMRLQVLQQSVNLKMTVVAPNGTVYRNDNSGASVCSTCPLVKIRPVPVPGWYTVNISHATGVGLDTFFVMTYSRYPGGNPNCASPTVPSSTY